MKLKNTVLSIFSAWFLTGTFVSCVPETFAPELPPVIEEQDSTQNVSGFLPEHVLIRTMTQSYCKYYEFAVIDGRIYAKKTGKNGMGEWSLFTKTGLPHPSFSDRKKSFDIPQNIVEISADNDVLYAFDDQGIMYICYLVRLKSEKPLHWKKLVGFPQNNYVQQNDLVLNKRSWSMGARRSEILWYEDIAGNQHHYGTMGIETVYFLTEDGRKIRFTDSGLPQDFSRSIENPEDGRFIAQNLSASGDTLFIIGSKGSMYTRLIDFDTMGCDPMFIEYTYDKLEQKYSGSNYLSNYSPWALPAESWKKQPLIEMSGMAKLSKMISIAQTGQGNEARELRVAGLNSAGETGYYHKMLNDNSWYFTATPLEIADECWLDPSENEEGEQEHYTYNGFISKNGKQLENYSVKIENASLCSEGKIKLTISSCDEEGNNEESWSCQLFDVEKWTYMRHYNPGYDGTPRYYFLTAELDEKEFENYSEDFRAVLEDMFAGKHHKLFAFSGEAETDFFQIDFTGKDNASINDPFAKPNDYKIFALVEGEQIEADSFFYRGAATLKNQFSVLVDPVAPSVLLEKKDAYDARNRSEIQHKIFANKSLQRKLEDSIETYRNQKDETELSRWGYGVADVFTKITLLNHINFPKIKQMTSFGGELINSNADRFKEIAEYGEWAYPHLVELLKLRIKVYEKYADALSDGQLSVPRDAALCDNYKEYYEAVNIPEESVQYGEEGLTKDTLYYVVELPTLSWFYLELNDGTAVLLRINGSAEKIYGLKDRSPEYLAKHPLKFNAVMKVIDVPENVSLSTKADKNIFLRSDNKDVKGKLIWNGEKMEILVQKNIFSSVKVFSGTTAKHMENTNENE